MNNSYNLLMLKRINMINQDLNEEYIRKFNLSIDTIKRKKKKKLKPLELDELTKIITDLQNIPKDEKYQDYILRHLKVFLIYGNVKLINRNNIVLELKTNNETTILYIEISKECISCTIKGKDYREEATWKTLGNDYYTKYKTKKINIYEDKEEKLYNINIDENFHGFHDNKEIFTRLIYTQDNYIKNKSTEEIDKQKFRLDNYKEITNYYRKDDYIVRKYKKKYQSKKIDEILGYRNYQISEDYHKDEKYLNSLGYYKKFDRNLYNPFLRGKCSVKTLYK